jgi:hypothetical protein
VGVYEGEGGEEVEGPLEEEGKVGRADGGGGIGGEGVEAFLMLRKEGFKRRTGRVLKDWQAGPGVAPDISSCGDIV